MSNYPEPVVGIFLLNEKKEILLCKSHKWGGSWVVAGGHINIGETIREAVAREAREELGVEVGKIAIIDVLDGVFMPEFYKNKHFIFIQCSCYLQEGSSIKIDNDEIQEAKWFNINNIPKEILSITGLTIEKIRGEL